jgi:predicted DNA-binding mobile mystery protein A
MAWKIMTDRMLARRSLEKRLAPIRHDHGLARPPHGWVRAIREALGMTTTQLARRLGVSQSRASRLQQDEVDDAITLHKLREAAAALDCTLIYALVPNRPLDDILLARAQQIAEATLARVSHTMSLENQSLTSGQMAAERERLVASLLASTPKRLWDEP